LEIEKLEKQRALDNETIARKEAETKKQRVIILFVICGLLFVVGFSLVLFNLFLQKKKANRKLAQQNIEIQQKNEEITTQRDEIKTQRNKLSNQNHLLAAQKQKITDSITYAKRIQQAVLPDLSLTLSKG